MNWYPGMSGPFDTARGEFDLTPERQAEIQKAQAEFEAANQPLPLYAVPGPVAVEPDPVPVPIEPEPVVVLTEPEPEPVLVVQDNQEQETPSNVDALTESALVPSSSNADSDQNGTPKEAPQQIKAAPVTVGEGLEMLVPLAVPVVIGILLFKVFE